MEDKRAKRISTTFTVVTVVALLLISVPTLIVIFYGMSELWFKILNTTGLGLVTIRIVVSMATSIGAFAVKGEKTYFKKKMDYEAKALFLLTLVIQFINFTFIHFS